MLPNKIEKSASGDSTIVESPITLIDTTFYSDGFPKALGKHLIPRTNYLAQIEDGFNNDVNLFFIEGEEDSGKTFLAAQFVRKYVNSTISVFFNPLNNLDYQNEYFCSNAVFQIRHILKENISEDDNQLISTEQYRQTLYQLRKLLKRKKDKINIVIDGLELKIKETPQFIRDLFANLPFGEEYFRIIISGNKSDFLSIYNQLRREESKQISLSGFSDSEISKYLGITDPEPSAIRDLYKVTKGYPGRLKTLKRLIDSEGYTLEEISSSTNYTTWLELDCESVDLTISKNNVIMSLLCLTERSFSKEDISKICLIDIEEVESIVDKLQILDASGRIVSITSPAHKRYLANILRINRSKIDELLIKFYAENESLNSLIDLPVLYTNKREWGKVIEILDERYLNKVLETTGSLKLVTNTLELGVQAAEKSTRYPDMLRYAIQGSIVNELDNYLFWESEIEARISIHDFIGAIALAESAVVLVDRLRLLALIARRQKEFNNSIDEVLINLIQELYKTIDLSEAGEKIYDIVSHLIYAIPNLAIEIIEKSSGEVDDNNINDWVLAKLSIAAIDSDSKDSGKTNSSKKIAAIPNLNNSSFKKINRAISFLVGNYTAEKVLDEVQKISDSDEKLKLLRLWLTNNRTNVENIETVIDTALNELIATSSETSVSMEVLNELTSQLPFVKDPQAREQLYKRFRSIENDLSEFGMTKSKFIFRLSMFHTEYFLYRENSIKTINKIINDIDDLDDLLVKIEAYAETFDKLTSIKHAFFNDKVNFIYSRILKLTKQLYDTTASQYKISEYFIKTIGKQNPRLALKIIYEMNNVERRERSRIIVWESYLDNNLKNVQIDILKEIEKTLEVSISKDMFYLDVLERYAEAKSLHHKIIFQLLYFTQEIHNFSSLDDKIRGYTLGYRIILKNEEWKQKLAKKFEDNIYNSWNTLEADWEKIDQGFTLCYELAKHNTALSKRIFDETEQIKSRGWLDSKLVAYTYLYSIKLIIRAFYGLMSSSTNTDDDLRILGDLIARVPSEIEKLRLWTEVGFYAINALNDTILKKVTNERVIHMVHDIVNKKIDIAHAIDALTLIHITDPKLVDRYLNRCNKELKEASYGKICDYYITKRNPFEAYEEEIIKYNSVFGDLTKAISVLDQMVTDSGIFYLMDHICRAIQAGANKELSKPQITTLTDELKEVAARKFPDQKNIKHDGFKILADLKIARTAKHSSFPPTYWEDILNRAEKIPNLSDIIFIKSILLEDLPFEKIANGSAIKKRVYESIIVGLNALPAHYEFVERVIDISENMYAVEKTSWKKCVDRAFNISGELKDGTDVYQSQKKIIDSMYRLDSSFAKELVKQLDNDNQQTKINKLLNKHLETLEVAEKIKNNKTIEQKSRENATTMVNSIYMILRGLNSERILPKKIADISNFLQLGNKLPLHEVFPIYMYYLNNCARMYRSTKDGSMCTLHKDNFREAVSATNLIQILSQKKKVTEKSYRQFFIDEEFSTNKAIKPGTREAAFAFIRTWIAEQAEEFIIIADPYFGKEDLEILKLIKETNNTLNVDILGSKDAMIDDVEDQYRKYWKKISDEEPPFVNITFVRTQDNADDPFHDRWLITKNSGLRIGTSINSLGIKKESEISVMKPNEALRIREDTLSEYITRRKREFNNQRLYYRGFSF